MKRKIFISSLNLGTYVIVRTRENHIHAGILQRKIRDEVALVGSRRIALRDDGITCDDLASNNLDQKYVCLFNTINGPKELTGVVEIIRCNPEAEEAIRNAKGWGENGK